MQVAPSGGQICNKCKRCHVVAKFNPSHGVNFWVRCASGNVWIFHYLNLFDNTRPNKHSTSQIHNINFPFKVFFSRRISTDPIKIHTEPIKKPTDPIKIKCTDKQGEYHRIQVKSYKDLFMNFNHSKFLDRKVVYISNIIWSN